VVLYLFDGYNILHAGDFAGRRELVDLLASYVAVRGARGVVVFDGVGEDAAFGALEVRFATPADPLLERLAAEHRRKEEVWVVSSDAAVRGTAGQETRRVSSKAFVRELAAERRAGPALPAGPGRSQIEDALDDATRERLERIRRSR
jgi:predicted RNA-binding protein with PIN domain